MICYSENVWKWFKPSGPLVLVGDRMADVLYDLIMRKSQALQNIIPVGKRTQDKENKLPVKRYDDIWYSTRGSIRHFTNNPGVKVTAVMRKIRKLPQVKYTEKQKSLDEATVLQSNIKKKADFWCKLKKNWLWLAWGILKKNLGRTSYYSLIAIPWAVIESLWISKKKLNWLWDRQVICLSIR